MHLSVMSYSFRRALTDGTLDLPSVIGFVRDLGVDAVEIMDADVREEELPVVETALRATGARVVCYDLVCDVISPDAGERRSRAAAFRQRLGRAARLGAPFAMVIPGPLRDGVSPETGRRWFAEALRESLDEAARLGMTLTVENLGLPVMAFQFSDNLLELCQAVGPRLRVTYDAGNFLLPGEDTLSALDRLAPHVAHVHFKDWHVFRDAQDPATRVVLDSLTESERQTLKRMGRLDGYPGSGGRRFFGAALGDGAVNLRGAYERLRQVGYTGAISVEYEGLADPRVAVRRGVEFLRSLA